MWDSLETRIVDLRRRLRRIERRELAEFRRWVENTDNLIHLSILLFVPLLIAAVTAFSNLVTELSFLLFPPLASGTYTLFADPEGRYANPLKFVVGLTVGALCGWVALNVAIFTYGVPESRLLVHPESAALAILLTGGVTWVLDVEEPSAFSTALLILLIDSTVVEPREYVASVLLSSILVAIGFSVWRSEIYEERAQYLYESTHGDDHVLVPMRGETSETTALFGARLAAAHDAGKVVLLDVLDDERLAAAERAVLESDQAEFALADRPLSDASDTRAVEDESPAAGDDPPAGGNDRGESGSEIDPAVGEERSVRTDDEVSRRAAEEAAASLESYAERIRTQVGVPCEVIVATGDPATTTVEAAREANCDLIVTPYESDRGLLSEFVRSMFASSIDTVAFRSTTGRKRWQRIMVPIARPGDSAHAMIDFAERLAGRSGTVSVCTCISDEVERRPAENRLANLAETARRTVETRVARSSIEEFLAANAGSYDLVILGSSRDRSTASRFVSPPTFERLRDIDSDVAVVDRGKP
jgi:nucleotide-binding universal stress UspA family protein